MAKVTLDKIVAHCNRILKPKSFEDWPGAVNGLQVQNSGSVSRIAAAVDATPATIGKAIVAGVDLLIVHHGLFWGVTHPWTGNRYKLLRMLLDNNIAIYSSHLPLDAHPRLGNNAQLTKALGIKSPQPFFTERGQAIGLRGTLDLTRAQLAKRLTKATGTEPTVIPGGSVVAAGGVLTGFFSPLVFLSVGGREPSRELKPRPKPVFAMCERVGEGGEVVNRQAFYRRRSTAWVLSKETTGTPPPRCRCGEEEPAKQ